MRRRLPSTLAALLCGACSAWAQQPPDAGRLLQENRPAPEPPRASPQLLRIQPPGSAAAAGVDSGARATINEVRIEGLQALDANLVVAQLPPAAGRSHNIAELNAIADQVQAILRARGLPFARAYLPPQDLAGGVLRVAVIEGRFGEVTVTGAAADAARPWLAPLRPGDPIRGATLGRSLLLLNDLPGANAESVLRPGTATGTGDLLTEVNATRRVSGEVGLDNHGNRYSGRWRVRGALDVDGPFTFGDQLSLRATDSESSTWLGSIGYSAPIGTDGLRAVLSASRTDYTLRKEFANLGAHGTADTISAGLTYPLVREQQGSVRLGAAIQGQRLHDLRDAAGTDDRKRAWIVPLTVSADRRDASGVTWGSATVSFGRLRIDEPGATTDAATARTAGQFTKLNGDIARVQAIDAQWTFFGRLAGQWTGDNLDSSQKMVLGGVHSVRAWPSGEAAGDIGLMAQFELRWRWGQAEPFVLLDAGRVRINAKPWTAGDNTRGIAGAGAGVRWQQGPWIAEGTIAWRTGGGKPVTEPGASQPQAWVSVGWRF